MPEPCSDGILRAIFAAALRAFPPAYRRAVGDDLLDCLIDRVRDRRRRRNRGSAIGCVLRSLAELGCDAVVLRLTALRIATSCDLRSTAPPLRRPPMRRMLEDLSAAARSLARRPVFLAVTTLTLALGIGASTTVFGVLDAVLLRPLPYPSSERLMTIGARFGDITVSSVSYRVAEELEREEAFDAVAAIGHESLVLARADEPVRVDGARVNGDFFRMLGAAPAEGRGFEADDESPGAAPVAILGHAAWQRLWAGQSSVLGQTIQLGGRPTTIIGILPADFLAPEAVFGHDQVDVWLPMVATGAALDDAKDFRLEVIARRAPSATEAEIGAAMSRAVARFKETHPDAPSWDGRPFELWSADLYAQTVGDQSASLEVLVGTVGFLLLIACANVANLFLARGTDRRRELALRSALGAGRGHLVRLLLTENLLVALGGGVIGVGLAQLGTRAFVALSPGDIPRLREVTVDLRVAVFALLLALVTGALFGLIPALRATGTARSERRALAAGAISTTARTTGGLRNTLVAAQVATALVLVTGAALLLGSLLRIVTADPGFDPQGLVGLTVTVNGKDQERNRSFYQALEAEISTLPGLETTVVSTYPMSGSDTWTKVRSGDGPDTGEAHFVRTTAIGRGWLQTLTIPMIAGRTFGDRDRHGTTPVALVNQSLARQLWGERSAVGQTIKIGTADSPDAPPPLTVVGVVGDLKQRSLHRPAEPELFRPLDQQTFPRMRVLARSDLDTEAAVSALRQAVRRLDPYLVPDSVHDIEAEVRASAGEPRFYTALVSAIAGVALLLALVGVFGSMSYRVARRVRELGIRIALGAARRQVTMMVVRQGLITATIGIAIGLGAAWYLSRFLGSLVYGIGTHDPLTFLTVTALLLGSAALACYLPARRAAAVDPVRVLRSE